MSEYSRALLGERIFTAKRSRGHECGLLYVVDRKGRICVVLGERERHHWQISLTCRGRAITSYSPMMLLGIVQL